MSTGLEIYSAMNSSAAASSAAAAARDARAARKAGEAARDAAEERLEGTALYVSFVDLDLVKEGGGYPVGTSFWKRLVSGPIKPKERLGNPKKIALKNTDISHLSEHKDDFGSVYTRVHLEGRANHNGDIFVGKTIEEVQAYINTAVGTQTIVK